jgi:hypothetical protein
MQSLGEYKTETNLLEFIHRIRFEPREFGSADYYFGYHWPGIYNSQTSTLKDPFTGKTISVEPVYLHQDSFIAKAVK